MNNLRLVVLATAFAVATISSAGGDEVVSLRGSNDLANNAEMFKKARVQSQQGGFKRSWKLQPPSIPHTIGKDRINLQENTCMRCHSEEKYKEEKAVKIGDSHFIDADGVKSDTVNARRHFCTLCHTPQNNVDPLVENTFNLGSN